MDLIPNFLKEMKSEGETTRKFLKLVPADKYDWKPHDKSMSLRTLAVHLAEVAGWTPMILNTSELDFAKMDYTPSQISTNQELLDIFEKGQSASIERLEKATEAELNDTWTMRKGDYIISAAPKHEMIRHALNQTTHHRAQLGVYLRLLNIPIPSTYGPTADDGGMF